MWMSLIFHLTTILVVIVNILGSLLKPEPFTIPTLVNFEQCIQWMVFPVKYQFQNAMTCAMLWVKGFYHGVEINHYKNN